LTKLKILLPLFNDWQSLELLLQKINNLFKKSKIFIEVIIVNDKSTSKFKLSKNYSKIRKIRIIDLNKNLGSQKAIFIGLHYIYKNNNKSTIVVMDSDGEDDPLKIISLMKKVKNNPNYFIFVKRTKRLENFFLKFLNKIRLIITYLLTGKYLNIGNFSAFHSNLLKSILTNKDLSLAYCSGVIKNYHKLIFLGFPKKKRFYGNSKVNFLFLFKHSINIISVFYKSVLLRTFILFLLSLLYLNNNQFIIFFVILIFNIILAANYFFNRDFKHRKVIKNVKIIK
tara:strand:- start:3475 stop:4323 length:849 start_codon:yes stop_codon:yes gene_type:complete